MYESSIFNKVTMRSKGCLLVFVSVLLIAFCWHHWLAFQSRFNSWGSHACLLCSSELHWIMLILHFTLYVMLYQVGICVSLCFLILLVFTNYYFTFPLKFLFQCDWCLDSLWPWGAHSWLTASVCHVDGLTL